VTLQYGLVGSTEWVEDFPSWISRHVVAYLNTDLTASGSRWEAYGSPLLAHLIKQTALDVPHPTTKGKTLWDARTDEGPFTGDGAANMTVDDEFMSAYVAEHNKVMQASDTGVRPLGSGSDYTAFLQRLGVSCVFPVLIAFSCWCHRLQAQMKDLEQLQQMPFTTTIQFMIVHDSKRFMRILASIAMYVNVLLSLHLIIQVLSQVAIAKHMGLLLLRLSDSIVVPMNTTQYAFELDDYLDK